eukprot:8077006-Pyramimonas_sp.AAC.2
MFMFSHCPASSPAAHMRAGCVCMSRCRSHFSGAGVRGPLSGAAKGGSGLNDLGPQGPRVLPSNNLRVPGPTPLIEALGLWARWSASSILERDDEA